VVLSYSKLDLLLKKSQEILNSSIHFIHETDSLDFIFVRDLITLNTTQIRLTF